MIRIQKITALLCALALAVSSFGTHMDNARAASKMVTPDDGAFSREIIEKGTITGAGIQQLLSGKKVQGKVLPGNAGQRYQITLNSSGQLDIHLEGAAGKLATRLTDKNGKGWAPRRRTADGKQTYQLKKGTYYYQVEAAKGAVVPETGLDYAVTATFQSAQARFEGNDTRKKAAKPLLDKVFYGHLAQNAPVEYYKFTLKKTSQLSFTINTQMTDKTPETFVVSLYDKYGQIWSSWENPDWRRYDGEWIWDWEAFGMEQGLVEILPAGSYYVGVSIKRDGNGKVPASARYGLYEIYTSVKKVGLSVELSHKQAAYTGKKIKHPRVTVKKNFKKSYYDDWYYDKNDWLYDIYGITEGIRDWDGYDHKTIKGIGRYQIRQQRWSAPHNMGDDAYSIFTVTPIRGKINCISSKKKGQVQVSVKKNVQSTGYQIQIARDRKFRKLVKTLKTKKLRKTVKGLSHGKKYYVRVRNYKDVKTYYCDIAVPESIYGKWSKVRTVVCK